MRGTTTQGNRVNVRGPKLGKSNAVQRAGSKVEALEFAYAYSIDNSIDRRARRLASR